MLKEEIHFVQRLNKTTSEIWENCAMKKSYSMAETEIKSVRKWHKVAMAIWEDAARKNIEKVTNKVV
jgi:hypothetical protein